MKQLGVIIYEKKLSLALSQESHVHVYYLVET